MNENRYSWKSSTNNSSSLLCCWIFSEGGVVSIYIKTKPKISWVSSCRWNILLRNSNRYSKGRVWASTFTIWWTTRRFAISCLLLCWLQQNNEENFYSNGKHVEHTKYSAYNSQNKKCSFMSFNLEQQKWNTWTENGQNTELKSIQQMRTTVTSIDRNLSAILSNGSQFHIFRIWHPKQFWCQL